MLNNISIFDINSESNKKQNSQLATRMRPNTIEEFVGQSHIVGNGKLLTRMIKSNNLSSIILYGPTGTGKTTLANIIHKTMKNVDYISINATTSGTKDVKQIIDKAEKNLSFSSRRTLLFIDEIHRFNKSQQDLLLPHIENGLVILIGATTENPYFEVNGAIISRSTIFTLEPLSPESIVKILKRALVDKDKGMGLYKTEVSDEALQFIAEMSSGDCRVALNSLEMAVLTTEPINEVHTIDINVVSECIQKKVIKYDKSGDNHYNNVSALIKSMRGSDPNASLYYLAKMLLAGEDPIFIARRIVICASEDIGNADPNALTLAVSAMEATKLVGMPECRIILAQAVTYLATAPKSNASYVGIKKAMDDVQNITVKDVPNHLKDKHYNGAKKLGFGDGYLYPHNYPNSQVEQQYLPDELVGTIYYDFERNY